MKCLRCKWCEEDVYHDGESTIKCIICNNIDGQMEDCEDFEESIVREFFGCCE